MTTTRMVLIESQDAPIAQTTLYSPAAGVTATVDRMTATNTTAGALTISVNILPPSTVAGAANLFAKTVSIAAGGSYQFPEIVGHDIAPGGGLSVIASGAGIALRASGRETTSG